MAARPVADEPFRLCSYLEPSCPQVPSGSFDFSTILDLFVYIYIYSMSQQMSRVGAMPQDSRGFGAVEAVQSIPDEWRFS